MDFDRIRGKKFCKTLNHQTFSGTIRGRKLCFTVSVIFYTYPYKVKVSGSELIRIKSTFDFLAIFAKQFFHSFRLSDSWITTAVTCYPSFDRRNRRPGLDSLWHIKFFKSFRDTIMRETRDRREEREREREKREENRGKDRVEKWIVLPPWFVTVLKLRNDRSMRIGRTWLNERRSKETAPEKKLRCKP